MIIYKKGKIEQHDTEKCSLPTTRGEITILDRHCDIIGFLNKGTVLIYQGKNLIKEKIQSGTFRFHENTLNIYIL